MPVSADSRSEIRRYFAPKAPPADGQSRESDRTGRSKGSLDLRGSLARHQAEHSQRDRFRVRPGVADRADAPRTPVLTFAVGDQPPRCVEKLRVHLEQRLAEADPSRIVVVDEYPDVDMIRDLGFGIRE